MEPKFISEIKVELVQSMGSDKVICHAARVSTTGEACQGIEDKDGGEGLINYLMKHRHGTPFEHSAATFLVHAPIFVWREWHRHRIQSFNEESARYKTLAPVFYIAPDDRPSRKVENWKAGRPKFELDIDLNHRVNERNIRSYKLAYEMYLENLVDGADPGFARDCLPVGIYSSCWVTTNPRSLMAFLSLRTHDETSKFVSYPLYEIEVPARVCEDIFSREWPLTYKAWIKNGRVAP